MHRGNIDRDAQAAGPGHGFGAGAAQHPFADALDEVRFLGNRDEPGRADLAMFRMIPTHQRLDTDDMVVHRTHHRLVVYLQFVPLQRIMEIFLEEAAICRSLEQVGTEEAKASASTTLGGVERKIGVAHEAVAVIAVERRHRDAHRCADEAPTAIDGVGLRNAGDNARGDIAQHTTVFDPRHNDLKLVAAKAADLFLVTHDADQARGHLLEQGIAGCVAQRIVDLLEAIEVDQHDRARAALLRPECQRAFEQLRHAATVEQAGQRIMHRHVRAFLGRAPLTCDVFAMTAKPGELTAQREWLAGDGPPQRFAIGAFAAHGDLLEPAFARKCEGQGALAFAFVASFEEEFEEALAHRCAFFHQQRIGAG